MLSEHDVDAVDDDRLREAADYLDVGGYHDVAAWMRPETRAERRVFLQHVLSTAWRRHLPGLRRRPASAAIADGWQNLPDEAAIIPGSLQATLNVLRRRGYMPLRERTIADLIDPDPNRPQK
jgi:hypothetical protein